MISYPWGIISRCQAHIESYIYIYTYTYKLDFGIQLLPSSQWQVFMRWQALADRKEADLEELENRDYAKWMPTCFEQ